MFATQTTPTLVKRIEAQACDGLAAEIFEEQWPASFYHVVISYSDGKPCMKLGTGSGDEMRLFLEKLGQAFADGKVFRDACPDMTAQLLQTWEAEPDGRRSTLHRTDAGFFELEVDEGLSFNGRVKHAFSLFFVEEALARETAKHLREGMLDKK